jgi:hypothetical protein
MVVVSGTDPMGHNTSMMLTARLPRCAVPVAPTVPISGVIPLANFTRSPVWNSVMVVDPFMVGWLVRFKCT